MDHLPEACVTRHPSELAETPMRVQKDQQYSLATSGCKACGAGWPTTWECWTSYDYHAIVDYHQLFRRTMLDWPFIQPDVLTNLLVWEMFEHNLGTISTLTGTKVGRTKPYNNHYSFTTKAAMFKAEIVLQRRRRTAPVWTTKGNESRVCPRGDLWYV